MRKRGTKVGAAREYARAPKLERRKPHWPAKDARLPFVKYLTHTGEASVTRGGE